VPLSKLKELELIGFPYGGNESDHWPLLVGVQLFKESKPGPSSFTLTAPLQVSRPAETWCAIPAA
jgi:hypothetical protein